VAEARGQWARACQFYEQILAKDRHLLEVRERYQHCLRHVLQVRRHRDGTFQQQILDLPLYYALEVYAEVLAKLQTLYVEREKVDLTLLFRQGLEELRFALSDETFCQLQMPAVRLEMLRSFQAQLQSLWGGKVVRRPREAQAYVHEVALAAKDALGLRPTAVVLEFVCGACNALDEYTMYLTPGQLRNEMIAWKGELVGVGIEVTAEERKLVVSQVYASSPAERAGLRVGDQLTRIGGRATANVTPEAAVELLKGEVHSVLELEVSSPGDSNARPVKLTRELVRLASVSEPRFLAERELGIGYLQLIGFQDTTLQELDDAILKLQAWGMRVLILDLRGNPGGLFQVAIQVVERFLSSGLIVSTHGQIREYRGLYPAQGLNPLTVPLVVLIDGDTASSAELVAGALKDNLRGTLVGQTTFGKGSIQKVRKLTTVAAGIRLTVAKFYSPRGHAYSPGGVTPHIPVERSLDLALDLEQDPQVRAAIDEARQLAMSR
jgi:carboxyl-terminal processing protease